ncbi:hypothetical protein SCLCIDRAFT_56087, partial [Scleroderma citrinum Foug A]
MCRRRVQYARHTCGHDEPVSERKDDCGGRWCRYSSAHPRDCVNCWTSCAQ